MTHSNNYEIIHDLYKANENADLEAFYKDLAPTIVWKESDGFPTPGVFRSKQEIVDNVFSVLNRDWVNFHFELEFLIDGDEHVVAVGNYSGSHGKTGKHFEARASHVWHLLDGKIERFEQFADTHLMQSAATESFTTA